MKYWCRKCDAKFERLAEYDIHIKECGETKMTREEAIRKASQIAFTSRDALDIIHILEALGLIKFDQPVEKEITAAELIGHHHMHVLKLAGYRIVKLGKNTTVKMDSSVLVEHNKFNGKLVEIEQ